MKVNGKEIAQDKPAALYELIISLGYSADKIAVELNGCIVPKSAYKETIISNGDVLEIVSFVGGG